MGGRCPRREQDEKEPTVSEKEKQRNEEAEEDEAEPNWTPTVPWYRGGRSIWRPYDARMGACSWEQVGTPKPNTFGSGNWQ